MNEQYTFDEVCPSCGWKGIYCTCGKNPHKTDKPEPTAIEHQAGCPRLQHWDGGDEVRCTCQPEPSAIDRIVQGAPKVIIRQTYDEIIVNTDAHDAYIYARTLDAVDNIIHRHDNNRNILAINILVEIQNDINALRGEGGA